MRSDLAQHLRIQRQDTIVGNKVILYIKDTEFNEEMKLTRKVIGKFMTEHFDAKIVKLTV